MQKLYVQSTLVFLFALHAIDAWADDHRSTPIEPDPMGLVETLPAEYPEHWLLVMDAAFFHMLSGKVIVLDADADTLGKQYKGSMNASFIASLAQSTTKPEFYIAETFYSRGVRGDRTDVVTIYDKSTLDVLGEVLLPGGKRASAMPQRYALTLIDDDKLLLVYNFTPAQSITVVSTETRSVVAEVAIPGCVLAYPTGDRGFTSMCSDGGLLSTQLNEDGTLDSQERVASFFDTDEDPVFERPAIIDGIAYFPTFDGQVRPIDLNSNTARIMPEWSLVPEEEAEANWRPGGIAFTAKDDAGQLYVIMHPDGGEGTQNNGGTDVWVFDVENQTRVHKFPLKEWGLSIEVTRGENPLLVVTNGNFELEIYNSQTGELIRTLGGFGQETPFLVRGAQ
ncbi:MAG: amine dehydrogenase large subunit [Pseudomonadota bacterium]